MACRTPTLLRRGIAARVGAHSQGAEDRGLGTSLSPRTKEQLLEVISVFLDQLYFHQLGSVKNLDYFQIFDRMVFEEFKLHCATVE